MKVASYLDIKLNLIGDNEKTRSIKAGFEAYHTWLIAFMNFHRKKKSPFADVIWSMAGSPEMEAFDQVFNDFVSAVGKDEIGMNVSYNGGASHLNDNNAPKSAGGASED